MGNHTRETGLFAYYVSIDTSSAAQIDGFVRQAKLDNTKV